MLRVSSLWQKQSNLLQGLCHCLLVLSLIIKSSFIISHVFLSVAPYKWMSMVGDGIPERTLQHWLQCATMWIEHGKKFRIWGRVCGFFQNQEKAVDFHPDKAAYLAWPSARIPRTINFICVASQSRSYQNFTAIKKKKTIHRLVSGSHLSSWAKWCVDVRTFMFSFVLFFFSLGQNWIQTHKHINLCQMQYMYIYFIFTVSFPYSGWCRSSCGCVVVSSGLPATSAWKTGLHWGYYAFVYSQ